MITGVPSRAFPLVRADEIREGADCLSFSTLKNFEDDVAEKARVFVPRVGPMTVTMALRNTRAALSQRTPLTRGARATTRVRECALIRSHVRIRGAGPQIDKATYEAEMPVLRRSLLDAQYQLLDSKSFP